MGATQELTFLVTLLMVTLIVEATGKVRMIVADQPHFQYRLFLL